MIQPQTPLELVLDVDPEGPRPSRGAGRSPPPDARPGLSADALRYHLLVERLGEVVFQLDHSGRFTFLGPTWTALTGHAVEGALGQPLMEWIHPEDRPGVGALLESVAARVRTSFQLELRLRGAEAMPWVSLTAHGSPTGRGEVLGTLADVSERRRLEACLRHSERLTTLGMLVPGLAHEMNNPLAYLAANLDFLRSTMQEQAAGASAEQVAEWLEALEEAREGTERLRQIIGHLRGFRAEPGQGPVEVGRLLDSVEPLVAGALRPRGRWVRDYAAASLVASGDGGLRQALLGLVYHTVLSLPEGPGDAARNEVRLSTREDGQGRVVIEVQGSGPGLCPERLARVFEPLSGVHEQPPRPALSVCRDIVRGLGGELTASTCSSRGTVFRVLLPALA